MNTRKYMFKNSLVACFACCCISFASAGNPPFFPADVVTNAKGELLMADKGVKRVDVLVMFTSFENAKSPPEHPCLGVLRGALCLCFLLYRHTAHTLACGGGYFSSGGGGRPGRWGPHRG